MQWTYQITAASQPRVLMRLVQLFDQQALVIPSLDLALLDNLVRISIRVDTNSDLAHRLLAKLYNQVDVQNVELAATVVPPARATKSAHNHPISRAIAP